MAVCVVVIVFSPREPAMGSRPGRKFKVRCGAAWVGLEAVLVHKHEAFWLVDQI
jgi:hypothetical protein